MLDKHNREINYLRISITDRCNLRCVYCMPKEGVSSVGHDDILSYEEILRIVSAAACLGIVKTRVTGGEPLVRRGVIDFLRALSSIPGIADTSITTNGILLGEYAAKIKQAGIRRINVSLDSLRADRYSEITRGGKINKVMEGLARANECGLRPIKINMVPMRRFNEDEVLDFAALTLKTPFQVRFIELMPFIKKPHTGFNDEFVPNEQVEAAIRKNYELEEGSPFRESAGGPAKVFRIKGARGELGFISSVTGHFCNRCNRLRLTAEGHLRGCLLSDNEIDLKGPMRAGCSDEELKELIRECIFGKPEHSKDSGMGLALRKCARTMSSIGG